MRWIIKDQPDWIGAWVAEQCGFEFIPERMTAIGLVEGDKILGGVVFYDYSGTNIWMHVASAPGCAWRGARDFLKEVFKYVFIQCGCLRCSGWVPASNQAALRLDIKLGFTHEHTMINGQAGDDLLLMGMKREHCRWIEG